MGESKKLETIKSALPFRAKWWVRFGHFWNNLPNKLLREIYFWNSDIQPPDCCSHRIKAKKKRSTLDIHPAAIDRSHHLDANAMPNKPHITFALTSNLTFGLNFNFSKTREGFRHWDEIITRTHIQSYSPLFQEYLMHHYHQTEQEKRDWFH